MNVMNDEDQDQANGSQQRGPSMIGRVARGIGNAAMSRYRAGGGMSMRQDGYNVPGNQPGGANGSFGAFGQHPNSQPPSTPPSGPASFGQVGNALMGRFNQSPGGSLINAGIAAARNRYRGPLGGGAQDGSGADPALMRQSPTEEQPGDASAQSPAGLYDDSSTSMGNQQQQTSQFGEDDGSASGMGNQPQQAPTPTSGSPASPPNRAQPESADGGPAMANGGIVSKPTMVMLAEHGQPEAVVPLNNPNGKLSPGMFEKTRYRRYTGPSSVHAPMPPLGPPKLMR